MVLHKALIGVEANHVIVEEVDGVCSVEEKSTDIEGDLLCAAALQKVRG